ncbi:agmatine deiminase [Erwinia sp. OLTSP20]|uniref:agmatine deiminase n=1 Tax=unclassified Erwinia TaxID=2622719 RepID=UPI000C192FE7|nr:MULTISPECIES: agmatine deiminase [unclassified Erwinia]PIJ50079.1 agmatine deiminase [Erwinia sp. OAMSP11]PIJ71949.1 agmatine deiminase [Erwinia sp. OLSSP12]PIJ80931.1 agmatine deiminase [Erwinia sp. OLCASP19]PIJ83836.1 agmatine deiminase [Erwinia sp. OLMTSP26]PIJ85994.1 agmatine deiminase [Erwinia sp. OLMDSP33]
MSKRINSTPRRDGFRMPGEHQPQQEIWMVWPERTDNWRNGAKPAQKIFVEVAKAIAQTTPVTMVASAAQFAHARELLPANIRLLEMSSNDSWMRDIGPTFVMNAEGERRGVDWHFNAWGGLVDGLYFPWDRDDQVAQKVCEAGGFDSYRAPIVLEGGSIHTDGEGTLFVTEECLLHPSRNSQLNRHEIEHVLCEYLGVDKVIWIPNGLFNDETNGHVDNLIHVVRPGEIVLTWCDNPSDPQYDISRKALDVLESQSDAKGRKIKVHKIPLPGPLYISQEEADGVDVSEGMQRESGERLAASYANYLITNGQIVYPLLDPKHDAEMAALFKELYPGYMITGVPAREILLGGGNIHCITQQIPVK